MPRPRLSLPAKIKPQVFVLGAALIAIILLVIGTLISIKQTSQTFTLIKQQNFAQAQKTAGRAKITPIIISTLTFRQSATIESWRLALDSVDELENFATQLNFVGRNLLDQAQPTANLKSLEQSWQALLDQTTQLEALIKKSWWLKNGPLAEPLLEINQIGNDLLVISQYLSTGKKQILVLLQNTEEIRATGGFMGSYAKISFDEGKVVNLQIQDIYEPDGQFQGFVDAPPGANEYLSGGKGLRLPDSNWSPDFPSSAKVITTYFSFGHERDIDVLMTLNVDLIERVLKIVGDVYLPDYGLTASAENLTDLAHADRNGFFAGSKQKVIFLESLFTNLKFKIANLSNQQIESIVQTLRLALPKKELQFFAWEEEIENLFIKHQIAGDLHRSPSADFFLAQVESNVGINKANKNISRNTTINVNAQRSTITTFFHHQNQTSAEDYINYHRYYLDPAVSVKEIAYNGQTFSTFDEGIISTTNGETFKQIGVTIALSPGTDGELTLVVDHPTICEVQTCSINIWKQSGLPPTPYTVITHNQTQNFILEQDELVKLNQL